MSVQDMTLSVSWIHVEAPSPAIASRAIIGLVSIFKGSHFLLCIPQDIVQATFNVFIRSLAFQLLNDIISINRTYYIMRMTLFCVYQRGNDLLGIGLKRDFGTKPSMPRKAERKLKPKRPFMVVFCGNMQ
jgi:hypothetical protein